MWDAQISNFEWWLTDAWNGFRDPIYFSRWHPMTGASLGSYMSKPFTPITISSYNTERDHKHTKKNLTSGNY